MNGRDGQRTGLTGKKRMRSERDELRAEAALLRAEVERLRAAAPSGSDWAQFVAPGHFYSPIPSLSQVRANEARLFGPPPRTLPGVDLRETEQLALLPELARYYREQPFAPERIPPRRYGFENPSYSYCDALFLYGMIRHARPRRILEIGSGHSSCVSLDTNELFFENRIQCTFVEPYPELLRSLLRPGDEDRIRILATDAQSIELSLFDTLEANDILFIDSTHVSKVGSDVNYLFFEVLPRLRPGVLVHVHDVFYPFEYPREWVYEGRAWTEDYLLRGFLTFNSAFEIVLMNTFLERFHEDWFREHMPLCLRNPGGSIWLRRRA
jgi:predicted O-methyltransferase YrrM